MHLGAKGMPFAPYLQVIAGKLTVGKIKHYCVIFPDGPVLQDRIVKKTFPVVCHSKPFRRNLQPVTDLQQNAYRFRVQVGNRDSQMIRFLHISGITAPKGCQSFQKQGKVFQFLLCPKLHCLLQQMIGKNCPLLCAPLDSFLPVEQLSVFGSADCGGNLIMLFAGSCGDGLRLHHARCIKAYQRPLFPQINSDIQFII